MALRGRRWVIQLVLTAVLLGALSGPSTSGSAGPAAPNIVLVFLDDADKATVEEMPNIGALIADQGMTFDRFYTSLSQCCPSRASLLTGRYVHNHKVISNTSAQKGGFGTFRQRGHESRTIARTLRERDYATALFGKYLNEYGTAEGTATHRPRYWNRWFGLFGQAFYNYSVNDDGRVRGYGSSRNSYATSVLAHETRQWVQKMDSRVKPFFAFASFTAPHSPYVDPPGHRRERSSDSPSSFQSPNFDEGNVDDKPGYVRSRNRLSPKDKAQIRSRYQHRYRMLLEVDDFVKRLVSELEESGELANTYIFVASDNGFMQGEHRLPKEKGFPYEESVNVSLIVRGPGIAPGTTNTKLVSMVDLFATFADLAGADELRDGRSIVPLFSGADVGWRDKVLVEWTHGLTKIPGYDALITPTHKYVRYVNGAEELYDLQADPFELESLDRSNRDLVEQLKAQLGPLRTCSAETCRTADGGPAD